MHTLHDAAWGNWGFHVEKGGRKEVLQFLDGGWQEQTGSGWGSDCSFFAEHVPEELDAPGEFTVSGSTLTLIPNGTDDGWKGQVEVGALEQLVSIAGSSQSRPVRHLAFRGLTFTQTTSGFMNKYTSPGVGDWSIYMSAAMMVDKAEHLTIDNCTFTELGSNAVLLHGNPHKHL